MITFPIEIKHLLLDLVFNISFYMSFSQRWSLKIVYASALPGSTYDSGNLHDPECSHIVQTEFASRVKVCAFPDKRRQNEKQIITVEVDGSMGIIEHQDKDSIV